MKDLELARMLTSIYDVLPNNPTDAIEVLATCLASAAHSTGTPEFEVMRLVKQKFERLSAQEIELRQ